MILIIEDLPKLMEFGVLGAMCFVLIFKGIGKMQELTDSIKSLTGVIGDISRHVDLIDARMLAQKNRLNALEQFLREELYKIKFNLSHGKMSVSLDKGKDK